MYDIYVCVYVCKYIDNKICSLCAYNGDDTLNVK